MGESSPYKDSRQDFFKRYFELALPYKEYLASGSEQHRARWEDFEGRLALAEESRTRIAEFKREINVLVMSGIWCGDCARQGPIFRKIEEASPVMTFRFIDNKENPELQEELRINGAQKVPVIVALSEDFFEVGRYGDKHLSVYRRKAANELGPACDPGILPPSSEELGTEVSEWVDYFERLQWMLRLAPALRRRYGD